MARYKTKHFEIEAVQFLGDLEAVREEFPDINLDIEEDFAGFRNVIVYDHLQVTWVVVNNGDFIIKGMEGEFYPCAEKVFKAKYEVVNG